MKTTAIILAAGMGKRLGYLTDQKPKALLEVGGKSLLEHAIDIADGIGADEIIIVGGYLFKQIEAKVHNLKRNIVLINNTDYAYQTLDGVVKGLASIQEGNVFICNSDYIKLSHTIAAMKANAKGIAVYASFDMKAAEADVMKIKVDSNNLLLDISKKLVEFNGLYTGDFFCAAEYLLAFKKAVARAQQTYDPMIAITEHSFIALKEAGLPVKAVDIGSADWFEIDTPEELNVAVESLLPITRQETINCNLCGKTQDEELYKDNRFRVVICIHCSLVYLNPRMDQQGYDTYYQDEYQKDRHDIINKKEAIERLQKKDSYSKKLKRFDFMKPYITKDTKVLEIGAGMGTQLKVIKDEVGCSVEGLEISSLGAEVANEYYGIPVKNVTLEAFIKTNEQQYTFSILHHVLEHFLNPSKALQMIHSFTKSKGFLYIAVPNMTHPDEPLDRFFRVPHTYYFTFITLTHMLKKTGWAIVASDIGKQEIRLVALKSEPRNISAETLQNTGEVRRIRKIVNIERAKYKGLRVLKNIAGMLLPNRLYTEIRTRIITLLRKLGIITV